MDYHGQHETPKVSRRSSGRRARSPGLAGSKASKRWRSSFTVPVPENMWAVLKVAPDVVRPVLGGRGSRSDQCSDGRPDYPSESIAIPRRPPVAAVIRGCPGVVPAWCRPATSVTLVANPERRVRELRGAHLSRRGSIVLRSSRARAAGTSRARPLPKPRGRARRSWAAGSCCARVRRRWPRLRHGVR